MASYGFVCRLQDEMSSLKRSNFEDVFDDPLGADFREEEAFQDSLRSDKELKDNPVAIFNVPESERTLDMWVNAVVEEPRLITFFPENFLTETTELMKIQLAQSLVESSTLLEEKEKELVIKVLNRFGESDSEDDSPEASSSSSEEEAGLDSTSEQKGE